MSRRNRNQSCYIPGDFWRIDDLSGFRIRASNSVKMWNGLIVARGTEDVRNQQDFVRAVHDNQRVPDPRPEYTGEGLRMDLLNVKIDDELVRIDSTGDQFLDINEVTANSL